MHDFSRGHIGQEREEGGLTRIDLGECLAKDYALHQTYSKISFGNWLCCMYCSFFLIYFFDTFCPERFKILDWWKCSMERLTYRGRGRARKYDCCHWHWEKLYCKTADLVFSFFLINDQINKSFFKKRFTEFLSRFLVKNK